MNYRIGNIVIVMTDHPSGVGSVKTEGEIGVITEVQEDTDTEFMYLVTTRFSNFYYSENEIRLATENERNHELTKLILKLSPKEASYGLDLI